MKNSLIWRESILSEMRQKIEKKTKYKVPEGPKKVVLKHGGGGTMAPLPSLDPLLSPINVRQLALHISVHN